jgi:hypothetical protein
MGRPTKLTSERITEVANNIYPSGNYFEVACELAGISATTGYAWLAIGEGRAPNTTKTSIKLFREFSDAVRNSEAKAENAAVIQWRTAFSGDWRAAAEYLSRRFPTRWKKVERQEVTGADGGDIKHSLTVRELTQGGDSD